MDTHADPDKRTRGKNAGKFEVDAESPGTVQKKPYPRLLHQVRSSGQKEHQVKRRSREQAPAKGTEVIPEMTLVLRHRRIVQEGE